MPPLTYTFAAKKHGEADKDAISLGRRVAEAMLLSQTRLGLGLDEECC